MLFGYEIDQPSQCTVDSLRIGEVGADVGIKDDHPLWQCQIPDFSCSICLVNNDLDGEAGLDSTSHSTGAATRLQAGAAAAQ